MIQRLYRRQRRSSRPPPGPQMSLYGAALALCFASRFGCKVEIASHPLLSFIFSFKHAEISFGFYVLAQAKGGLRAVRQTGAPTSAAARHCLRFHACSDLHSPLSTSPSPDHAAHAPARFPHTGHGAGDGRGRALAAGGRALCAQGLRFVPEDPFRCVRSLGERRTLMLMPSRVLRIRSVCVPMDSDADAQVRSQEARRDTTNSGC